MKKGIAIMLCILMVISLAGCTVGQKTIALADSEEPIKTDGTGEQQTGIPNPMKEMESADAVNDEIGCWIVPLDKEYFQLNEESFCVIDGETRIGEYRLTTNEDKQYVLRAAVSKEDISGIYMDDGKMPHEHLTEENPYEIIDTGYGLWSRWFMGGMQYSLSGDVKADSEEYFYMRDSLAQTWPWYGLLGDEEYVDTPWTIQDMRNQVVADTESMDKKFGTKGAILFESLSIDTMALWPGYSNIVSATTADELLDNIASDTMIVLPAGEINLSTASSYGTEKKGNNWYWEHVYDGGELVIHDVDNFCIVGNYTFDGTTVSLNTTVSSEPRYANVLYFKNCTGVTVTAITAGHTVEPDMCSGGVLYFDSCRDCRVIDCDLYGCGTYGVEAYYVNKLTVTETVIHDCTCGHLNLFKTNDIKVEKCSFLNTSGFGSVCLSECSRFTMTESDIGYNNLNIIFDVSASSDLKIRDCLFIYNYPETVLITELDGVELEDSAWLDYSMDQYEPVPAG